MNKIVLKYKKIELLNTNHICIIYALGILYIYDSSLTKSNETIIIGKYNKWMGTKKRKIVVNK